MFSRVVTWAMLAGVCLSFQVHSLQAQNLREQYIETYKDVAVSQMYAFGIPASITLAQGCLESGNGTGRLAVEANNHFGIKCHEWSGERIYHDDDADQECFRKYATAADSYLDHSHFLKSRPRYASLFDLEKTDYKGWATGLQEAGYATNPQYARLLIDIIEKNRLYEYDTQAYVPLEETVADSLILDGDFLMDESFGNFFVYTIERKVHTVGQSNYILAEPGDTYESIAKEFNLFTREVLAFNEVSHQDNPAVGERVYIEKKASRAIRGVNEHTVGEHDTVHSIAQKYGIKESALRAMNNLFKGEHLTQGQVLRLR